jgi:N utilization substance protein A
VQSVVQELRGEKIDIVAYNDDQAKFVCAALSPAKVDRVFIDEENRAMEVIVPDDQLSLAIGKNGQNVRLAVKITGWKIDVKSESSANAQGEEGYKILLNLPGVDEDMAARLFAGGIKSIAMVAASDVEMLMKSSGVDEKKVLALIEAAVKILEDGPSSDKTAVRTP